MNLFPVNVNHYDKEQSMKKIKKICIFITTNWLQKRKHATNQFNNEKDTIKVDNNRKLLAIDRLIWEDLKTSATNKF